MAGVSIRLLGGFAADVDGEPVPEQAWRLKKARELIKLLALAPGHRLHREQAMDALWRDRGAAAAANNLNQAVHVARRALGVHTIELQAGLLRLAAAVDVDAFEQAAAAAQGVRSASAYRGALALYGGELLPENRYDDWAADRRERLAELEAALTAELAALGPAGGPRGLPEAASSFVGRGHELDELRSLIGRARLLTLSGAGGTGKTRLALELARSVEAGYGDGVALVELAAIVEPRLVADAVAVALDVRPFPGQQLADALAEFLAPRAVLLVLDNCEHVLGASAALADKLLRAAPLVTLLVTSREPLHIPGEVVFRVPSLAIPAPDQSPDASELLRYESVTLFAERAAAAAPGFVVNEGNAADVARICFRLDGLPLALELAAGRIAGLTPAAIAERLDDRFRLLRAGNSPAPTRQQTLEATLQWSHDLLGPDERVLFRRLAAFAGGFDLAAAETVCAGEELDGREIADILGRLVEKSLVATDDRERHRRYRLLETVRLYAQERLDEARETETFAGRQAGWALGLAERDQDTAVLDGEASNLRAALDTLSVSDPLLAVRLCVALRPFWLRRIDLAEAQRRFAEALAAAPERTALRAEALLAAAAIDFRSGALSGGLVRAEESLAVALEIGDARAEWRALQLLGEFAFASDDAHRALRWLERGLDLSRRHGFAGEEALGVYSVGVGHWILGDLARADAQLADSIELFTPLADLPVTVPSPVNLADVRTGNPGDRPGLRILFEETLQPFVEVSCAAAIGYVLANRATIARANGDFARARELVDASGARFEQLGDERGQADVLVRRGYLELAEGSLPEARNCLERALELRRRANERRGVGMALSGLGLIETAAGDYARAERHLDEARALFRRAGDPWGLVSALWRTADLALAREQWNEADTALAEALNAIRETRRDRWIAHTLADRAEVALRLDDPDRAELLFAEARDRFAAAGDAAGVGAVDERMTIALRPR